MEERNRNTVTAAHTITAAQPNCTRRSRSGAKRQATTLAKNKAAPILLITSERVVGTNRAVDQRGRNRAYKRRD
jgi:hypothetical protein